MVTSVSKSTIIQDVWKNFYDRVKAKVTTVSITGSETITVQNYVSSFPDQLLDSKTNYPVLVVRTPNFSTEQFTLTRDNFIGTIDLEIYTNQGESADKFLSSILNAIETYKRDLRLVGIVEVELQDTESDNYERAGLRIHYRRATFNLSFKYTMTKSF
jgi:hypothetical protein